MLDLLSEQGVQLLVPAQYLAAHPYIHPIIFVDGVLSEQLLESLDELVELEGRLVPSPESVLNPFRPCFQGQGLASSRDPGEIFEENGLELPQVLSVPECLLIQLPE